MRTKSETAHFPIERAPKASGDAPNKQMFQSHPPGLKEATFHWKRSLWDSDEKES